MQEENFGAQNQNQEAMTAKLTITRYHFVDPTIMPLEKMKIQDYLNFLSNKNKEQQFHATYTPRAEHDREEKGRL